MKEICTGIAKAIPILIAYLPLGIAVGLLARESDLNLVEIGLMSAAIYTCIGQIVAIKMLASGSELWSIVLAVFVVSLRHMLMSVSLAPYLRGIRRSHIALLAFGITDEPFALGIHELRYGTGSLRVFTGIVFMCWFSWLVSCLIGYSLSHYGAFFISHGFRFALPALLISLMIFHIKGWGDVVSALVSCALTMLSLLYFNTSLAASLIIICWLGAIAGTFVELWTRK